ncbi:MAG: alpha/beta hydrolase [Acidobacteria bacterium]|nr:MAG: alpha/beta hydrolase [Acidobacteriota bacterium]PYR45949.1 MAG: alpha/beta hydrolase [Acidobacteriota bacterium]
MRWAVLLAALTLPACQPSAPGAVDRLHPCQIGEGPPDAFCGKHAVFEDRTAKTGRQIDLKIVVAPALRRNPRADPLFVFEGGPGGGAATLAPYRVPLFKRFQTDRDIVLIDQRGTGSSNSLDCERDDRDEEDLTNLDEYPTTRFRKCLEGLKADPRFYTTPVAVDDFDEVRQFLGYGVINLWGGSYGTRTALVYLKRHEASVRSVVLDGVAPPDMRLPLYMARDGQRALDRLLADCSADSACSKQFPNLKESVQALWTRLAGKPRVQLAHPRTGRPLTINVTPRLVASIVFQSLYSPEVAALLPRLLTDAASGQYQGLMALAFSQDLPKGAVSEGMFLSVVCAEDMPRIAPDEIAREAEGRFFGTAMFDTRMKPCEFWPRGVVADDYYEPVTSEKPVLIFSGEDDPVTPPSWGDHVARHLKNSRHVVVPGAGHITLTRGCVPQVMASFLDSASVDGLDVSCAAAQRRPPFFTSYAGPEP